MASYISKKHRVFRDSRESVTRRKSEGHMKTIVSCTDTRAWATANEEQRQYILDLIRGPSRKCNALGKYVPVDVLLDVSLANKNADIERLKSQIEDLKKLLSAYEKLELTPEQRERIGKTKMEVEQPHEDETKAPESQITASYHSGLDHLSDDELSELPNDDHMLEEPLLEEHVPEQVLEQAPEEQALEEEEMPEDVPEEQVLEAQPRLKSEKSMKPTVSVRLEPGAECSITMQKSEADQPELDIDTLTNLLQEETNIEINSSEQLKVLKKENDELKQSLHHSKLKITLLEKDKSQIAKSLVSEPQLQIDVDMPNQEIKHELETLKKKYDMLSSIQKENESLKRDYELLKITFQKDTETHQVELQSLRDRSKMLDEVMEERKKLKKSLEKMSSMKDKLKKLKNRANEADELEKERNRLWAEVEQLKIFRQQSDFQMIDIQNLRDEKDDMNRSLDKISNERDEYREQSLKKWQEIQEEFNAAIVERDMLRMQLNEYENMKADVERLRLERDQLRVRVEELSVTEIEMYNLVDKNKQLNEEKGMIIEDILKLNSVIYEKEDEINRLVTIVEEITQDNEEQQEQLRCACQQLRSNLNNKDVDYEESVALAKKLKNDMIELENQLQSTINSLTKDIKEKENEISCLQDKLERNKKLFEDKEGENGSKLTEIQDRLAETLQQNANLKEEINKMVSSGENDTHKEVQDHSTLTEMQDEMSTKERRPCGNKENDNIKLKEVQNQLNNALQENAQLKAEIARMETKSFNEKDLPRQNEMQKELLSALQENQMLKVQVSPMDTDNSDSNDAQKQLIDVLVEKELLSVDLNPIESSKEYILKQDELQNLIFDALHEKQLSDTLQENEQLKANIQRMEKSMEDNKKDYLKQNDVQKQLLDALQENAELKANKTDQSKETDGQKQLIDMLAENEMLFTKFDQTKSNEIDYLSERGKLQKHIFDAIQEKQLTDTLLENAQLKADRTERKSTESSQYEKQLLDALQENIALKAEIVKLESLNAENQNHRQNETQLQLIHVLEENENCPPENDCSSEQTEQQLVDALLENQLADSLQQNAQLRADIERINQKHFDDAEQNDVRKQLDDALHENAQLRAEIDLLHSYAKTVESDLKDINADLVLLKSTENIQSDLKLQLDELTEKNVSLEKQLNDEKAAREKAERENVELEQKLHHTIRKSVEEHGEYSNKYESLKIENDKLNDKIYDLTSQMDVMQTSNSTDRGLSITSPFAVDGELVEDDPQKIVNEIEKLTEKNQTLLNDVEKLKCEIACLKTYIEKHLDENANDSEQTISHLKAQIVDLKGEIDSIRNCTAKLASKETQCESSLENKPAVRDLELKSDSPRPCSTSSKSTVSETKNETSNTDLIKDLYTKIEKLEDENRELINKNKDQINELSKANEIKTSSHKSLKSTNEIPGNAKTDDLNSRLEKLENENKQLVDENKDLTNKLSRANESHSVPENLDDSKREAEIDKLQSKINELDKKNEDLSNCISELQSEMESIFKENEQLKEKALAAEESKIKIDELEKENMMLENQCKKIKDEDLNEIKQLKEKIKQLETDKENCELQSGKLREEIEILKNNLDKHENTSEPTTKVSENKSTEDLKMRELENKIKELEKINANYKEQIDDCKQIDEPSVKPDPTSESKEVEELKKQLADKETSSKRDMDEINSLRTKLSAGDAENSKLLNQIEQLKNHLASKDSEIEKLTNEISILKQLNESSDNADLLNELDKLREDAAKNEREINALRMDNSNLTSEANTAKSEMADMKEKLQIESKEADKTKAASKELGNEIKEVDRNLEKLESAADDLPPSDLITDSIQQLSKSLDEEQRKVSLLEEQLRKLELENADLKDTIDKLTDEIETLKEMNGVDDSLEGLLRAEREKCDKRVETLKSEHKNNVALLKKQYEKDLQFIKDRHGDGVERLQDMHEDALNDINKSHKSQMKDLQKQYSETSQALLKTRLALDDEKRNSLELKNKIKIKPERDQEIEKTKRSLEKHSAVVTDIKPDKKCLCTTTIVKRDRKETRSLERPDRWHDRGKESKYPPMQMKPYNKNAVISAEIEYTYPVRTADGAKLTKRTTLIVDIEPEVSEIFDCYVKELRPIKNEMKNLIVKDSFNYLLVKAIRYGLESLSFGELKLINEKARDITLNLFGKNLESDKKLETYDKITLIRRIATLEDNLISQHKSTQQKVYALNKLLSDKDKRLKIQENHLINKAKQNQLLLKKLENHASRTSDMKAQSNFQQEKIQNLLSMIEEEKSKVRRFQTELEEEKNVVSKFKKLLKVEKEILKEKAKTSISIKSPLSDNSRHYCPDVIPQKLLSERSEYSRKRLSNTVELEPCFIAEMPLPYHKKKKTVVYQGKFCGCDEYNYNQE